ncbi:hypothetical protein [Salinibacter altiplanensis]|uniref:hypothetical protein n=1 Tax=Salinibacter altiplanensis TaxID=1803181 RepID=UPI000C9EE2DA|nr:hypothetical protein [Salinibacter altiplanensis]
MPNTVPERHDIDFWSSHPINWPAIWAVNALVVVVIGLSLWVGDYSGAASLAGIGIGGGGFVWSRVLEQWDAEGEAWWRRAGFVVFGVVILYQVFSLVQLW